MKIVLGITSTTHIDSNNDKITKEALEGMALQIKKKLIPLLVEHDWDKNIGTVLYGEVFQLEDGEYAIGTVSAVFENEKERKILESGKENIYWPEYKKYLNIDNVKSLDKGKYLEVENKGSFFMKERDDLDNIARLLDEYFRKNNIALEGKKTYEIKARVALYKGMEIVIYSNDHDPPHFHVISKQRNFNVKFSINTLELIGEKFGDISRNEIKGVQSFFKENPKQRKKLQDTYKKLFPNNRQQT